MPVEFDEYQGRSEDIDWAIDPLDKIELEAGLA